MALSFSFDASKGETPEQLARRRQVIEALNARQSGQTPKNMWEGLNAIGQALGYRKEMSDLSEAEKANTAYDAKALGSLLGGGATPAPAAAAVPSMSSASAQADPNSTFSAYAPKVISQLSQDFDLTPDQAAGVVGQLGHESRGLQAINEQNPTVPGSRGGFGWAQWTGPRRREFESFAQQNGMDVTSPEANYAFLANELRGSEGKVLNQVRSAPDAISAGRAFTDGFLRPGVPNYASRDNWTNKALAFAGGDQQAPQAPYQVASAGGAVPSPSTPLPATGQVAQAETLPEINVQTQPVPVPPVRPDDMGAGLPQAAPVALQRQAPMPAAMPQPVPQQAPQPAPNGAAVMAGFGGGAPVPTAPSLGVFGGGGFQPGRGALVSPQPTPQAAPQAAPASPVQRVAQALQAAPQGAQGAPDTAGAPVARVAQAMAGQSPQSLVSVISDPRVSEKTRGIAQLLLKQQMETNDPMRQLQMQKLRQEVDGSDPTTRLNREKSQLEIDKLRKGPEAPSDVREYEYYVKQETDAGRQPLPFGDYTVRSKRAGASSVNIDQKGETEFDKSLGQTMGKTFGTMYEDGTSAAQDLAQIDRLQGLLTQSGTGFLASAKAAAAGMGIQLGPDADAGTAANAIINQMVPRQRVPGSGTTSDRDLATFRAALPSLAKTPGGNEQIMSTLRGLAEYRRAQGDIAGQVMTRDMSQQDGIKAIRALPDPFAAFKTAKTENAPEASVPQSGGITRLPTDTAAAQSAYEAMSSGTVFIDPNGKQRRKP